MRKSCIHPDALAMISSAPFHHSTASAQRGMQDKRTFLRKSDGATSIELALIAIPFFLMFFAIVEMGLMFYATVTLENGVIQTARKIRTGELVSAGGGLNEFRTELCSNVNMLLDCDPAKLLIDVRVFNQFDNVSYEDHMADGNLADDMQFNPGTAEDIVLVRVFYTWKLLTPILGKLFNTGTESYRLLNVNFAFRNEPYIF